MKKLLLSLVVVAASGAYVTIENRDATGAAPGADASASIVVPAPRTDTSLPPTALSTRLPPAVAEPVPAPAEAAARSAVISPMPAPPTREASAAPLPQARDGEAAAADGSIDVAEIASPGVPGTPVTATDATRAAPLPPLPRPRPATAPDPSLEIAQASAAGNQGRYINGTYQGVSANAYYGRVQVSAVIAGGEITSIKVQQYPNDRGRSRRINYVALPMLEQEVIAAQSANVDIVSGATLTSEAYMQSLSSALAKAGGNNA